MCEQNVRARNDVNASSDHGCGMNQRADWRRAFHGVGEPNVERKLRGFSGCAHEEQQGGNRQSTELAERLNGPRADMFRIKQRLKIQSSKCAEEQEHSEHEAEIADAIDDEGFFARVRGRLFQEPKTNE